MKLWMLAALLMGSASAATTSEVARAIDAARTRVLVFAPSVFDAELGNALRRARLDPLRGVTVRVLTVPYFNYAPKSVALSLALAGVRVSEAQIASTRGLVIVDDRGWRGETLGRMRSADVVRLSRSDVNDALRWFDATLRASRALTQLEAFERLRKVTP